MGFKSLIKAQVKQAFNAIKDLADDVILTSKNVTGYNFGDNTVAATSITTKSIKGLLVEKKRDFPRSTKELPVTKSMQMIFQAADLDDPDVYDTITMSNGDVWRMVPPYKNDGFLITVDVARST
jgi:hypothetical protein